MKTLGIDLETYSEIDITEAGSFRYIEDKSFEVLLFAYSVDNAPAQVIDLTAEEKVPTDILDALYDPNVMKTGWNNAFERFALWKLFGRYLPPEQWEDTMVLAAIHGLPLNLDGACKALKMPEDKSKMAEGKALIRYFCKPCKATKANGERTRNLPKHAPEKWELFKDYCKRDVDSEGEIRSLLIYHKPDKTEHTFWCLDARINENGIRIDIPLAINAIEMDQQYRDDQIKKMKQISGLSNPKSVAQIKNWLERQEGIQYDSLGKSILPDIIASVKKPESKEFLRLYQRIAKSSTAKYQKMLDCVCRDQHVKGCFQFYGASRTGRFAGRLLQLQNLPQNHLPMLEDIRSFAKQGDYDTLYALFDSVPDTLSQLIRTALIPEEGHRFIVCDFSAIEARVIAWFAGEEWVLEEFRGEGLIYEATASQMFGVPKNDIRKGGKREDLRPKGKIAQLACGYGGGVNSLRAFGADKMGMSEEEMTSTVDLWRSANPRICRLWKTLEFAAKKAIRDRGRACDTLSGTVFRFERGTLWMQLPSGREIAYFGAQIKANPFKNGKEAICYQGTIQQTRKFGDIYTWGGKLTENLVQATARDILRDKMLRLEQDGWNIRAHVHDEVILSEPYNSGRGLEDVKQIFAEDIPWAKGLPLRGDGFETEFYKKD